MLRFLGRTGGIKVFKSLGQTCSALHLAVLGLTEIGAQRFQWPQTIAYGSAVRHGQLGRDKNPTARDLFEVGLSDHRGGALFWGPYNNRRILRSIGFHIRVPDFSESPRGSLRAKLLQPPSGSSPPSSALPDGGGLRHGDDLSVSCVLQGVGIPGRGLNRRIPLREPRVLGRTSLLGLPCCQLLSGGVRVARA